LTGIPDILSVVLRAVSFVLQLQAAGAVFFAVAFGPALTISLASVRCLARGTAGAALLAVAGCYLLEAARMAGDMSGLFDSSLQDMNWNSTAGGAFSVQMLGLLLIIAGMRAPAARLTADRLFTSSAGLSPTLWLRRLSTRGFTVVGLAGAVLVAGSFALTGHTVTSSRRALLAPLLLTHLLIVSFWLGALWPLCLVTLREPRERASRVIALFSAVAVWLVPLILLVGAAIAALLLPDVAALGRPYGKLVIAKAGLFALLMVLAALNKWRLGPALDGVQLAAGRSFRRVVVSEYAMIVAVLSVTAVMTTLFSPE
jgi:putative copper resistance protein D